MKLPIKRIFSVLRNKKNLAIVLLIVCISLTSSGIIMFVYDHSFGEQQLVLMGEQRGGDNAIEWSSDGQSFTTLSNDGYIWFNFDTPIDMERLVINYSNHSMKPWRLQVFYATPEIGFNQDASTSRNLAPANDRIVLNYSANNVSAIRIDWGDDAGRVFSVGDVQINLVDKATQIELFLIVLLMLLVIGLLHFKIDTERGFKLDIAIKRLVIKNVIVDLLFVIMSYYGLFWEKGEDYILICNLLLIYSAINIGDYIIGIPFHWNKQRIKNNSCLRSYHAWAVIVIIMAVYTVLLFNVTQGAYKIATVNEWNSFIFNIFIGAAVYIFSIKYMLIENRLWANFLMIVTAAVLINYVIQGFSTYYVCAFFLFAVLMLGIEERRVESKVLLITVLLVLITYILSMTNTYVDNVYYASSGSLKRTLGFLNPNGTSLQIFYIALLFAYIHNGNQRKKLFENLSVLLVSMLAISFSGGRTSLVGNVWLIAISLSFFAYSFFPSELKKRLENKSVVLLLFAQGILFACAIGSFYSSWRYDGSSNYLSFNIISKFFNTRTYGLRLQKAYKILHSYMPKLWGQVIPDNIDGENLFIENAYVDMMLRSGIILFVSYIIIISILNIRLWKNHQYYRMLLLISISIVALGENVLLNPINNIAAFIAFSNIKKCDDCPTTSRAGDYTNLLAVLIIAGLWIVTSPLIVCLLKTCIEGYEISDLGSIILVTLFVIIGVAISRKVYLILSDLFENRSLSQTNKRRVAILAVELLLLVITGTVCVGVIQRNLYSLADEMYVLKLISDNSKEKIYADRLPVIYRNNAIDVKCSYLPIDDLSYESNVTLITNVEDDKAEFFSKCFLYMPISDDSAIYTNNADVIELLRDNGYHLLGYNNHENCIDLLHEAELNDAELNAEGKIVLNGDKGSLDKGPFISLSSGKYTVYFELHMEELPNDKAAEVASVSVSNSWGQNVLGETVVTAGMFDSNGDCKCDIQINGNGSGYEFGVDLLSDACLQIEAIKYAKTPDYDTHILVDNKWRKIHEEYYDLDGKPFECSGGYYGINFEYDDEGNVSGKTYLDKEMNPVITTSGYASIRLEYNDKRKVVRESYYDTEGIPIALPKGQGAVEYEYDEAGNITTYSYFGVDNEPILYEGQYWRKKLTYNELRQILRESYFDTHDEPVSLSGGRGTVEYEYDEAGNRTTDRYYDSAGNPVLYYGEYWYVIRTYNERKQNIHEEYYGFDGKLFMRPNGGYCSMDIKYDELGEVVRKIYYDLDGGVVKEE